MASILTAAEMKAADEKEISRGTPSRTLMERAARAALRVLREEFPCEKVLFLCGGGNNGGDGFAMARFFAEEGGNAAVCYAGAWQNGSPDTSKMSAECAVQFSLLPTNIPVQQELSIDGVSAVVDALFGIGLTREICGGLAAMITRINASALPVLAVDIPSGVDADNGSIRGVAIRAAHTVSMAAYKFGQILFPGTLLCGKLHLADIGISRNASDNTIDFANILFSAIVFDLLFVAWDSVLNICSTIRTVINVYSSITLISEILKIKI